MQISGEANSQDISSQTLFLLGGLGVSDYALIDQVRNYNIANSIIWARIFRANGWQFDDRNQTDLPIATTALNTGQKSYSLVGSASINLSIRGMRVKDSNGKWHNLTAVTEEEIKNIHHSNIEDFRSGNGLPKFYRPYGKTFDIYPASDSQVAAGLECSFDRGFLQIAYNATTYVPGFHAEFHEALAVFAAMRFCQAYPRGLSNKIPELKEAWEIYVGNDGKGIIGSIEKFYRERWVDKRPKLIAKQEDNR